MLTEYLDQQIKILFFSDNHYKEKKMANKKNVPDYIQNTYGS